MYLVVIAWMYVALMMAVAEATHASGTLLGAIVTFLLYGVAPCALVIYLMGTPARRRAIKAREAAQWETERAARAQAPEPGGGASAEPDAGGQPAATASRGAVAAVRKES